MAQFHISQATLNQAINGTETCANTMRQIMSTTESNLASLTHSGQYIGSQQVAFARAHTAAQEFATRLNKDLNTMQQLMAQAGKAYGSADSTAHDDFSQLSNSGPDAFTGGASRGLPGF